MIKTILVTGTKGGVGKSITAAMIIPIWFKNRKINIFELDSSNTTRYKKSKLLSFESMKLHQADDVLDEIDFNTLGNDDSVNIIDTGGGTDTAIVLNSIAKSELDDIVCIIPINDDIDQVDNVKDTISAIKSMHKKVKIFLMLNRTSSLKEDEIKKQYVGIFGSEKYDLPSRLEEIQDDISGTLFVRNTAIFGILKNHYQTTLLDVYFEALDLRENINELKLQWYKDGIHEFKKKKGYYRFAKDVIALSEELDSYSKIFEENSDEERK